MAEAVVSLEQFAPLPEGDEQYSVEFIKNHSALKLGEEEGAVLVGAVPGHPSLLERRLRRFHGKPIRILAIDPSELAAYLGRALSSDARPRETKGDEDERIMLDRLANDAPVVNLVNSVLIDAVRLGASDIHIEGFANSVRVRYRLDGVLKTQATYDASRFAAIASRIKIMANLNIMERRRPQDGRVTVTVAGQPVDMRVSIVPIARGESIVLRIFGARESSLGLGELGFDEATIALMRSLYRVPHGLLLATGPTGSGKTTTLNAILREISSDELKIMTIEDPVEYLVDGVAQIQTNEQIHLGFDVILRRVLRQDPNVIMVGEMRDGPTAELAVRAALTGHLVLSTLHTNDSVSAVTRLKNMGVEPYLIASTLRGVIAQRLARKLCPLCSRARTPTQAEAAIFERQGLSIEEIRDPVGCKGCGGTGYQGRLAIGEIFRMDEDIEALVLGGASSGKIRAHLASIGSESLALHGLRKVVAGLTSLGEIEREVGL
jgi:general secretion pathway protein E/type IV pilus assembly protein PilB